MGCGESKHDVASGNTITRKKSNAGEQSKKSKDIGTVLENASLLVQQEGGNHQNVKNNCNNDENVHQVAVADHHVKDIAENTETKGGEDSNGNKEKGSLITKESPNRFFSSRKDEESVDGIEGRSEKSEYDSPRPEPSKGSLFKDNEKVDDDNAVEDKTSAQETISEAENAEALSEQKEENLAKETETEKEKDTATAVKAEASISAPAASAEKNLDNAEKEQGQSVASPSKDLKSV